MFAITLVVYCIGAAMSVVPLFWSGHAEKMAGSSMSLRVWAMVDGVAILCILGLAALLLLRTEAIARFACRGLPGGETVSVGARDLAVLGFSIMGLYCLIQGVPGVAWSIVSWRSSEPRSFPYESPRFYGAVVETVLGLWLFLSPQGFVRVAYWVRRAGAPEPSIPPTPPAGS